MHCEHARKLLDAYVDGELDAGTSAQLGSHVSACPSCAARQAERLALRDALRRMSPSAPAALRAAVLAELPSPAPRAPQHRKFALGWWQIAVLVLLPATMAFGLGAWLAAPTSEPDQPERVAARHAEWLARGQVEGVIASDDRHAVKPWFAGKVDFAPPVRDLGALGFRLTGGRLDRLGTTPAAVVTYRIRNHAIDLFVWRGSDTRAVPPAARKSRGYALIVWAEEDLRFAAVSDVDPADLQRFVAAVRAVP